MSTSTSTPSPTYCRLKGQKLVYLIAFAAGLGFLIFGYDLGYVGGLTTSPTFLAQFGNPDAGLLAFLVSAYEVGAMLGAIFMFVIGDRFGRKPNNVAGILVVVAGAALQASAFHVPQFLVGRIVAGFGLGIMTTVIPIWLAECAMPKSRGHMMAIQLSTLISGLIIANWLDYGFAFLPGSIQWRFPCAFQVVFCAALLCLLPFLPESPRYLAQSGNIPEATKVLAALRGDHPDTPSIAAELKAILWAIDAEQREQGSWADVFKDNGMSGSTRVLLAFAANFFQQLSGVNVMSSLGPYVFEVSIGMSRYNALLVNGGLQIFYFLSSLIPWLIVDRAGRRRLFIIGSAGMGLCMLLSAVFVGVGTVGLGYGAAVMLYLFQTAFTIGWQANLWIYPSELLPLKLRLRGGAVAVVSQWLWTFLVVEITPAMIDDIGYRTYIVFAVINFATIPVVYFCFPETCGLPLEAVDLLFADRDGERPSLFRVVKDSKDGKFMAGIEASLREQADARESAGIGEGKEKMDELRVEAVDGVTV